MDPTKVENGRGKVPHDPSLPFASTFSGMSNVVFACISKQLLNWFMATEAVSPGYLTYIDNISL